MRTNRILALLAIGLLAAPTVLAANRVGPTDIVLTTTAGAPLQYIPVDEVVRLRIQLNNTDSTDFNESLTIRLRIEREGQLVYNQTIRRAVSIPANGSTIIEQNWPPTNRQLGNHTLTVTVDDSFEPPFAATFVVTQTGVEAGSYAEKAARYSWFIGAFVLVVILFAVVLAARRA